MRIEMPATRRTPKGFVEVLGAKEHNLKNVDVKLPLGVFACVTGVSGAGKSRGHGGDAFSRRRPRALRGLFRQALRGRDARDQVQGQGIADVLHTSVDECLELFSAFPVLKRILDTLVAVGLGYMKIGQSAPTLSGGEAQRVKFSRELGKVQTGRTLYVLDEPTTGLHFEDIRRLLAVLQRLVEGGNSVVVIEHNLDVVKCADWVIDLGPEGGAKGGEIVCAGTPEDVAKVARSYTGRFLKDLIANAATSPKSPNRLISRADTHPRNRASSIARA